ncbi:MAG: two-partner secretion domain-containing protein, partial [Phycisphaerae bacterium]
MAGKMAQTEKRYGNRHLMAGATVTSSRVGSLLRYRTAGLLAAAAAMALPVTMAQAGGPIQVANVAAGTAAFSQAGSVTTITAANNTIINYQKFGIPHGNTVDFIQPSASARVLNRIIGPSPTQIDGNLNANGVVYFVNPAGVMFGAGAVVNVGQLYAAAGHLSDSNFLSGINAFTSNSGSITNVGVIKAGDVTFAAQNISNNGTILTPTGMVVMAAGKDVYVSKLGSPFLVQVAGTSNNNAKGKAPGVSNSGTINASGGDVAIRAGDMYSLAINTSGTIKASDVSIKAGGVDSTVLVSGKIDAANQGANSTGGTISVNGGQIGIGVTADAMGNYHNAAATLNASGTNGGGKILIGVKPDAASSTGYADTSGYDFIGSNASLNASATSAGSGGLVDTSGQVLNVANGAVIRAAGAGGGSSGEWLLDPASVTITGSTSTATAGFWSGASPPHGTFEPLSSGTGSYTTVGTVDTGTIDAALLAGDDVTITTSNGSTGGTGNIIVSSSIAPIFNFSSAQTVSLTLDAANNIMVNSSITSTSTGTVSPVFNIALNGGQSANNSTVTIAAAIGSATGSGVQSLVINPDSGGGVTGGSISISTGGTVITNAGGQTFSGPMILASNTILADTASGNIAFQSTVDATSNGGESLTVNTAGVTSFAGAVGSSKSLANLDLAGNGAITINGGTVTTAGSQTFTGTLTLGANTTFQSAGNLTFGAVTGQGFNITADASGAASVITLGGAVTDTNSSSNNGGTVIVNSSGTVAITSAGSIDVSGNNSIAQGGGNAGSITISGTNGDTIDGNLAANGGTSTVTGSTGGPGGGILVTSGSGNISLSGVTINTTGGSDGATSDGGGGGVGIDATGVGAISLTGVTIHTSSQGVGGAGAIALYSGTGTIAIAGSTFNSSGAGGGAAGIQTAADVTLSGANIITTSGSTGATLGGGGGISGTAASLVVGGGSGNGGAGNGGGVSGGVASAGSSSPNSSAGGSTSGGSSGGGAPAAAGVLTVTGSGTGNSITVNGPITGSTGAATFSSPTINLNASIAAPVSVTGSGVNQVAVGSSGSYHGDIQQGVSLLASGGTLDLTALAGKTSADNVVFALPIVVLGPTSGAVTAASWATSVSTAAVTISGELSASTTTGDGFNFTGTTTISDNATLDSPGSAQIFDGTVSLGVKSLALVGTNLNASPAAGAVFSGSTGSSLTLNFSGGANLGTISGLGVLDGIGTGTYTLNNNISTTAGQTYSGPVTLGSAMITLTANSGSTASSVTFGSTVDSAATGGSSADNGLAVTGNGVFNGPVGSSEALGTLAVSGTTSLSGNVTTINGQTYTGAVALTGTPIKLSGATLNASSLSGASFSGAGETLNLNFNSSANLGAISTLGILEDTGTGTSTLNGNITTTGAQSYAGAVTLAATPITLTANSGSVVQTVTFGGTVDGADTLNIGSTGTVSNAVFGGNVGGTINLAALNVSGTTTLSGNVTTVGGQVYGAA